MEELLVGVSSVRPIPRQYDEGVSLEGKRWSPACEDLSPEAEKGPPLGAATKQR
jgi:hypothetical protein